MQINADEKSVMMDCVEIRIESFALSKEFKDNYVWKLHTQSFFSLRQVVS
jgi:hypothetical protein